MLVPISLDGGTGNDTLIGGAGADVLVGGTGTDTASYANASAGVTANLTSSAGNTGDAAGDTYTTIENLTGSDFADTLTGSTAANTLSGGAGDDVLQGMAGGDVLSGGAGSDTASYAGSNQAVTVNLATGAASGGHAAGDTFDAIENLTGSTYNDTLTGDAGANILDGGAGNDSLSGGLGNDVLIGGVGSDTAYFAEGWGNDQFSGGAAGGWTDTININGVSAGPGFGGWTVTLSDGTLISDNAAHGTLNLGSDVSGVIVMSDGSELTFEGVERLQW